MGIIIVPTPQDGYKEEIGTSMENSYHCAYNRVSAQ